LMPGLLRVGPLLAQSAPAAPAQAEADAASTEVAAGIEWLEQMLGKDATRVTQIFSSIWHTVLIAGPDKKPLVTIGTLVCGIVLLGFGYIAAGMISRWIARKLLAHLRLSKSGVAPLQSLTFYLLLAMFTMVSLNVLNVPITVFSFLGGALAI